MALTGKQLDLPWLRKALHGHVPQGEPTSKSTVYMVQNLQGFKESCPCAVRRMPARMESMCMPSNSPWHKEQQGNTGLAPDCGLASPLRDAACNHLELPKE